MFYNILIPWNDQHVSVQVFKSQVYRGGVKGGNRQREEAMQRLGVGGMQTKLW